MRKYNSFSTRPFLATGGSRRIRDPASLLVAKSLVFLVEVNQILWNAMEQFAGKSDVDMAHRTIMSIASSQLGFDSEVQKLRAEASVDDSRLAACSGNPLDPRHMQFVQVVLDVNFQISLRIA